MIKCILKEYPIDMASYRNSLRCDAHDTTIISSAGHINIQKFIEITTEKEIEKICKKNRNAIEDKCLPLIRSYPTEEGCFLSVICSIHKTNLIGEDLLVGQHINKEFIDACEHECRRLRELASCQYA